VPLSTTVKLYKYLSCCVKSGVYVQDQGSRRDVEDAADMSFALARWKLTSTGSMGMPGKARQVRFLGTIGMFCFCKAATKTDGTRSNGSVCSRYGVGHPAVFAGLILIKASEDSVFPVW
jgi:hypothetical protein